LLTIPKASVALTVAVFGAVLGSRAEALDKVTMRLDFVFSARHAPIFVAQEKGYFKDENIELELLPSEGSAVVVKLVGNGSIEFGYAAADQVLLAASRDLPLTSIAVLLQKNPAAVFYPASLGIKSLKDLYGKTLGVQLNSNTEKQWLAVARRQNLDLSKIRQVPAAGGIVQLMAAKRIDAALGFYIGDALKMESDGTPMAWTLFADAGLPMYSTALVTNADLIRKNPDLVRRFSRAFMKGWRYAHDNPADTLDVFLKANPTADRNYSSLILSEILKLSLNDDTLTNGLGHSTRENWDTMQRLLLDMGIVSTTVDTSKVFTNEFLQ
jgi:NitT/TauT family transport system substrate-binding protein